jgi:hypothetical protein
MLGNAGVASIEAGTALGVSLVALLAAGWQWRSSRIRSAETDHNWKDRWKWLEKEITQSRLLTEAANQRAEAAERSAGASAKAAAASAHSAEASAVAARGIAELGKRAWVHATEFRLSLKTQTNENSTLDVWIANLGSTPARELKIASNFLVCDQAPPELTWKPRVNNVVLGPGVSFSLSHFLRVSPADLASIMTGRKLMVTYGQAQYYDVFGVPRETRWCATYDSNAKAFVATSGNNSVT